MIGLDTNVLVRFLIKDESEPAQITAARSVIQQCSPDKPGFINRIVLCELVWVLSRTYNHGRKSIGDVIDWLLRASDFVVENAQEARQALEMFRAGQADYADCLLAVLNAQAGCASTRTFDRSAIATSSHFLLAKV